jgi:hypothetical protein
VSLYTVEWWWRVLIRNWIIGVGIVVVIVVRFDDLQEPVDVGWGGGAARPGEVGTTTMTGGSVSVLAVEKN